MLDRKGNLVIADGVKFEGFSFGADLSVRGEVVFNTGMCGWPELLSDPALKGQILVLTYPLAGNYGVPPKCENGGLFENFESCEMQIAGLVVTDYCEEFSHWNAEGSLSQWLKHSGVPAICGVDTRELAKWLRENGESEGALTIEGAAFATPCADRIAAVSCKEPAVYGAGEVTVAVLDTGVKHNVIRSLVDRGVRVLRLPWNADLTAHEWDGLVLVDAPDDPTPAAANVRRALELKKPTLGVCGGDKILALAAGGTIGKLPRGHRSSNQPVLEVGTTRAMVTVQNHGYAVQTLPADWEVWFENLNDGSVEGIRHRSLPFRAVAWHPESVNRPEERDGIYDWFIDEIKKTK